MVSQAQGSLLPIAGATENLVDFGGDPDSGILQRQSQDSLKAQPQVHLSTNLQPTSAEFEIRIKNITQSTNHFQTLFEMSSNVLADRDVNASAPQQVANAKPDVKSMEYHRQVLQSKLDEGQ
jgi:hypothetical protein